jgi:hypothetical protein
MMKNSKSNKQEDAFRGITSFTCLLRGKGLHTTPLTKKVQAMLLWNADGKYLQQQGDIMKCLPFLMETI